MRSKDKTTKIIFILVLGFYIGVAVCGIAFFSNQGVYVGYRIPPLYSLAPPGEEESVPSVNRRIVGNVTSLNSVSYDFTEEPEVPAEPEPVEEPVPVEPEEHFYSFTSINSTTILHMRIEPSLSARVIAKLKPGTKGYVMEPGDDWSRVWAEGKVGYCSNEFLSLTEISREEIPEEAVRDDEAFITGSEPAAAAPAETGTEEAPDAAPDAASPEPVPAPSGEAPPEPAPDPNAPL